MWSPIKAHCFCSQSSEKKDEKASGTTSWLLYGLKGKLMLHSPWNFMAQLCISASKLLGLEVPLSSAFPNGLSFPQLKAETDLVSIHWRK